MEIPEITMEDIVTIINCTQDDFLIMIPLEEEVKKHGEEESV